jgi:hypothetical protein
MVVALLATHPALVPSYRALVWNRHAGLVLAANAIIGWTLDGAVLIAVLLTWQVLWCARWWDRHQGQARSLARNLREGGISHGSSGAAPG